MPHGLLLSANRGNTVDLIQSKHSVMTSMMPPFKNCPFPGQGFGLAAKTPTLHISTTWTRSPASAPASSFLLLQIPRGSGDGLYDWVSTTYVGELDWTHLQPPGCNHLGNKPVVRLNVISLSLWIYLP